MKSICVLFLVIYVLLSLSVAQSAPARTDVYHVHFTKAALGKAAQLGDYLKTPDAKAAMPEHRLVLRHQDGEDWDYVVIQHLGTKATVDAAGNPPPAAARDLSTGVPPARRMALVPPVRKQIFYTKQDREP